jgi:hypothetical protein
VYSRVGRWLTSQDPKMRRVIDAVQWSRIGAMAGSLAELTTSSVSPA